MDMNFFHSTEFHSSLHLLFQKSLCYWNHPILWLWSIKTFFVVPNVICQKLRNIDSAVAFWCFRRCNDIFSFQALIGFADGDNLSIQVHISEGKSQQLTNADSCPEKDLKRQPRNPFIHQTVSKLLKLILCPDFHLICLGFPHTASLAAGIVFQLIIFDCIVEDS